MIGWNHRIILHDDHPDPSEHWLGVHEVYYHEGDVVAGWTADPVYFATDADLGVNDLIGEMERALQTLRDPKWSPVLRLSDLQRHRCK